VEVDDLAGEVLPQQPVGVLGGPALPRALGITEETCTPVSTVNWAWRAISMPRSHVNARTSCSGSVCTCSANAFTTVAESWWDNNSTNRVDRSTSVPIDDMRLPNSSSPSQCPSTARSSASAGR